MGLIEIFVKILKDDDPDRRGMSTKDISKLAKKRGKKFKLIESRILGSKRKNTTKHS
jgi:hypothetical protein